MAHLKIAYSCSTSILGAVILTHKQTVTVKSVSAEKDATAPALADSSNAEAQAELHDHAGHDHGSHSHDTPMLDAAVEQLPTPTAQSSATSTSGATPSGVTAGATAAGPAPIGAGEVALTSDPLFASASYVPWMTGEFKSRLGPWGLTFNPSAVRFAADVGGKGVNGIVVAWDSAWGTKPITSPMPLNMSPIDAKASVSAVSALSGFGAVGASEQSKIQVLLGGEMNKLSAAARNKLRPDFATIKAASPTDQAQALEGLLTDKKAKPGVINSKYEGAGTPYTLSGPTEQKGYAFRGKSADAEVWLCTLADGQVIPIVAPKAPEAGHHYHTVAEAAEAASFLPEQSRKVVTAIVLNVVENPEDPAWAVKYDRPDFHSYMTAGASGVITVYPDNTKAVPRLDTMKSSLVHEAGHSWSFQTWGTDTKRGRWVDWQRAMGADTTAVSEYAMDSIAEDVAETVQVYVSTKGTPRFAEYQAIVPERFKILAADYK